MAKYQDQTQFQIEMVITTGLLNLVELKCILTKVYDMEKPLSNRVGGKRDTDDFQ